MQLATVTQKGQILLPKKIRDKAKISANSKVVIEVKNGNVLLSPLGPDILDLAGTFKIPKGAPNVLEAREYMETHYRRF